MEKQMMLGDRLREKAELVREQVKKRQEEQEELVYQEIVKQLEEAAARGETEILLGKPLSKTILGRLLTENIRKVGSPYTEDASYLLVF